MVTLALLLVYIYDRECLQARKIANGPAVASAFFRLRYEHMKSPEMALLNRHFQQITGFGTSLSRNYESTNMSNNWILADWFMQTENVILTMGKEFSVKNRKMSSLHNSLSVESLILLISCSGIASLLSSSERTNWFDDFFANIILLHAMTCVFGTWIFFYSTDWKNIFDYVFRP